MSIEKHGGNVHKFNFPIIDFSANLNPLGMPKGVREAVTKSFDLFEHYPDPNMTLLKSKIAEYHRVSGDTVCCGNGASDLIYRLPIAFKPQKAIIISPTFSEYESALKTVSCEVVHFYVKESDGFELNNGILDVIKKESPDMVFLCNPNNPTGLTVDKERVLLIAKCCEDKGARLIVDECFVDFIDDEKKVSILEHIYEFSNVIILKSFTKIFAMAGIRIGYCICSEKTDCEILKQSTSAWPVSTVASVASVAALDVSEFRKKTKEYIYRERKYLKEGLKTFGFRVYNSKANYIFIKSDIELYEPLIKKGIMIRSCENYKGISKGHYRLSVRTHIENEKLMGAIRDIIDVE